MPLPTTPEPRFEVPPEYADVYERAYRRAYEQGLGVQPASGTALAAEAPRRGRRVAVPQQRGPSDDLAVRRRGGARRAERASSGRSSDGRPTSRRPRPEPVVAAPEPVVAPPVSSPVSSSESSPVPDRTTRRARRGHRGVPRTGSTWVPLLVLLALALMLIAGAFVLGRATASGAGSLRSLAGVGGVVPAADLRTDLLVGRP